ncbi:hypothetical protein HG536_0B05860 [Torulaspora globosa]|uniref:Zn(2)-C6 fungal-type domain-containing protein n=1 Tax=Torulaspora globosa TaxID=48254 RepID=A0A7G3ZDY4_9SACH|nr:uncharacterized protein HG536_0B05860 [Torulaspora globosa]QLL31720.1 hypothetical protein HG536_0B05860 [Torulaspora globosa]
MSTSIPVINRNQTLPPLLLPDLRFLNERQYQKISFDVPTCSPVAMSEGSSKRFSTLESLANVATKRLKLSSEKTSLSHMMTPPPTAPVSAPISPSPSYVAFQENASSGASSVKSTSPSPSSSTPASASAAPASSRSDRKNSTLNTAKRQRIGPSCDGCRLKKIKCDASIEILLQDESIIPLFARELHHVFTRQEVLDHSDTLFKKLGLPDSILEETAQDAADDEQNSTAGRTPILIKHIDKIVLFRCCSSCRKRRISNGHSHDCCVFSKGFTRADINVFSKISSKVPGKSMAEMDITDYRNAGF